MFFLFWILTCECSRTVRSRVILTNDSTYTYMGYYVCRITNSIFIPLYFWYEKLARQISKFRTKSRSHFQKSFFQRILLWPSLSHSDPWKTDRRKTEKRADPKVCFSRVWVRNSECGRYLKGALGCDFVPRSAKWSQPGSTGTDFTSQFVSRILVKFHEVVKLKSANFQLPTSAVREVRTRLPISHFFLRWSQVGKSSKLAAINHQPTKSTNSYIFSSCTWNILSYRENLDLRVRKGFVQARRQNLSLRNSGT